MKTVANISYSNQVAAWAWSIIKSNTDKPVVVYFKKRTDGQIRRMFCYFTAQGFETRRFDYWKKDLLQVWDCEKGAPRFISMDAVEKIVVVGDKTYTPTQNHPDYYDFLADQYDSVSGISPRAAKRIAELKKSIFEQQPIIDPQAEALDELADAIAGLDAPMFVAISYASGNVGKS